MTTFDLSVTFFLEVAVILAACHVVGRLVAPLGQPQVVGEMIAGIVLGPSLLGWLAPELHARLFPQAALDVLATVAKLGLVLYMFLVGLEFDVALVRSRARAAVAVAWAGMLVPFALGGLLAYAFYGRYGLFVPGVKVGEAVLFLGAALSITAFPMLARIIREGGLASTSLGTLVLAAGAFGDAAAWCVLAVVLASAGGAPQVALLAVSGGAALAAFLLVVLRPRLRVWTERWGSGPEWERRGFPFTLVLLALVAWFADSVGIHAVFGAFLLGVAMPRGAVQQQLEAQIAPLTTTLLLPLFFTCTGLSTRVGLVATPALLGLAVLVLLAACAGKGLACYAAARACGETPREAAAVGALMNARGLVELILLHIGLERGIITPVLFSILVIMAIVTTVTALPIFKRVYAPAAAPQPAWGSLDSNVG